MRVERQVLFWLAALIVLSLAVLALKSILLPFVAGLVIAYALNPLADRLATLGVPRTLASIIIVALMLCAVVVAVVFIVPIFINQVQQFATALPSEAERLRQLVESWARERMGDRFPDFQSALNQGAAQLSSNWTSLAGIVAKSVWSQSLALVNFAALLLITPLVVFYMLVDWHSMLDKIDSWLPRDHAPAIRRLASEIDDAIAAFIRGQGLVCLILGAFYAIGLSWAGLPYGLLIGFVTGISSFVPFVGWAAGLLTASSFAVIQFWPDTVPLLKVLAIFAAGQALDAGLLQPKIVGPKIGLHPVWLIFALFVFSYLFGFVGVLVAVPVTAAIAVLVRFSLELYLKSPIYQGHEAGEPAALRQREHA